MRKSKLFIVLGMIALFLAGCSAKTTSDEFSDWSRAPENATLGMGMADYNNGFIYYTDVWNIFEYDLLTEKCVKYDVQQQLQLPPEEIGGAFYLNAIDEGVLFTISYYFPMRIVTFDDQKVKTAYESDEIASWMDSYLTDDFIYGKDEGVLKRYHTESGEVEILAERVLQYCKEKDALYYVAESEADPEKKEVFVWKDGKKKPEQIEVGMNPITICEEDGKLYMAEHATYQLYSYDLKREKLEKLEGVSSLSYQVRGDRLFYAELIPTSDSIFTGMSDVYYRDLKTGEDVLLKEQVQMVICVFSENAILCFENDHTTGTPYLITLDGDEIKEVKLPVF